MSVQCLDCVYEDLSAEVNRALHGRIGLRMSGIGKLRFSGNPRHCCLSTWRPANVQSSSHQLFSSFAWLTEPGIYYAEIGEGLGDDSSLLRNPQLYTFPKEKDKANRPISLVSTEFHVLIQYLNYVRVLSKLAGAIVFEDPFGERYGRVMGMCRDPVAGTVWVYSEAAVYRYKITDESRRNWRIFLAKGDYDAALRYCENDPVVTNLVRVLKAEDLLKKGEYEKSAAIYASTDVAFEEVALKFSRLRQEKALKLLITKKADSLSSVKDAPQLFMVCSWLMEIYLNSLGLLKNNEKDQEAYNGLLVEFRSFLLKPQFMDIFRSSPDVFYGLLLSHGADDEYVHFATQLGDTRRLVEFQLERDNYREALRVLATQTQGPSGTEMIYEFSPPLMRHVPKLVVDVWISKGHQLNPHRFLPSLQRYNGPGMETEAGEIIRYLEHCIHVLGSTDNALHNYLVALYCRTNNEDALLAYLITADEESSRRSVELYDRKGSLRLCVENDLHRAAVHLYCALNLHVEAVELALKIDPLLAKQIAKSVTLEEDIRKRLWLLIAQHLVAQDSDISKATELLQESSGVVKIEDILPFFPDFVTIDDFKEAICASLENYNHHIGSLKSEVDDATKEAEELRSEILDYRAQCLFVNAGDQCFVCKMPLLTHQFFLFPCRHHVHWDCLLNVVRPHLAGAKQLLLEELQKQLETLKEHDDTGSLHSFASGGPGGGATISRRDMVKLELEDIVAAECPFCGLLMIKSIDLPFIAAEEYESVAASWL